MQHSALLNANNKGKAAYPNRMLIVTTVSDSAVFNPKIYVLVKKLLMFGSD